MPSLLDRFAARADLHQSPMHAALMRRIGWKVEGESGSQIFYRTLGPLTVAKLQRPTSLDWDRLRRFRRAHHAFTTYVEPGLTTHLPPHAGLCVEPFAHSRTSLLDLTPSLPHILASFSPKTRYNVTHTQRRGELAISSVPFSRLSAAQLDDFFRLRADWSRRKNVVGYPVDLLQAAIKSYGDDGILHLAYAKTGLVACLLTLSHDAVFTYWAAFAAPEGNRLFAPTLLTWTALEHAKVGGCEIFDFGGIYDPRYPKMFKKWQGFTRFKAGFRPVVVEYPKTRLQWFW